MQTELPIFFDRGEVMLLEADSDPVRGYVLMWAAEGSLFVREWSRRADLAALGRLSYALGLRRGDHESVDTRACVELLLKRIEGHCPDLVFRRRHRVVVDLDLRPVEDDIVDLAELSDLAEDGSESSASELGWIEIQLRDRDERPIPNLRYEVRLPDRRLRWGYLDQQGRARVEDIPEGQCMVSFPDCDQAP